MRAVSSLLILAKLNFESEKWVERGHHRHGSPLCYVLGFATVQGLIAPVSTFVQTLYKIPWD